MPFDPQPAFGAPIPHDKPPYVDDDTTATRHLCAGAYVDDQYRDRVLREVYYQPKRLVAPSYGFTLVPVLGHCLKSRNIAAIRDIAICAAVVVAGLASPPVAFVGVAGLAVMFWTVNLARIVVAAVRQMKSDEARPARKMTAILIRLALLAAGAFFASAIFGGLATLATNLGRPSTSVNPPITRTPPRNTFPTTAATPTGPSADALTDAATISAMTAAAVFLAAVALPTLAALLRQMELQKLTPGHEPTSGVSTRRTRSIVDQKHQNTIAYSGYRPWIGSGEVLADWGFAQRLVRPAAADFAMLGRPEERRESERAREFDVLPFGIRDLMIHLRRDLYGITPFRQAEEHLPGLTVQDRVLLAGTEVSSLEPNTDPETMLAVMRHPTTPARHSLVCQVEGWGGELVTTVYIHAAVQGRSLYLGFTATVLVPCRDEFRKVDFVEGTGPIAWLRALGGALLDTPQTIALAPWNLARAVWDFVVGQLRAAAQMMEGYDYGARFSVREEAAGTRERTFIQVEDADKVYKIIERRLLASTLDFLDDRGVDISELRGRADTILNVGTGHFGNGNINTGNVNQSFAGASS